MLLPQQEHLTLCHLYSIVKEQLTRLTCKQSLHTALLLSKLNSDFRRFVTWILSFESFGLSTNIFSNYQKLPIGISIPFTMENNMMPAPINLSKVEVNIAVDQSIFKVQQ